MTIGQMAAMNSTTGGINSITNGYAASTSANLENEMSKFQRMLEKLTKNQNNDSVETKQTNHNSSLENKFLPSGRLNGDYKSDFSVKNPTESDKNARPQGFASVGSGSFASSKTIDKTSKLYEQSLELENYFVKIMLSSMRQTVQKSNLYGDNSYASKMYEDMIYDELSVAMTKNAGFGLADQIYLSLAQ